MVMEDQHVEDGPWRRGGGSERSIGRSGGESEDRTVGHALGPVEINIVILCGEYTQVERCCSICITSVLLAASHTCLEVLNLPFFARGFGP